MLRQMEYQRVIDLILEDLLGGFAGTTGIEDKFLLALIPGDGDMNRLQGTLSADQKTDRGHRVVLNAEHFRGL